MSFYILYLIFINHFLNNLAAYIQIRDLFLLFFSMNFLLHKKMFRV